MVQENSLKNKIIIICGPTASGKSALAIECAKILNTEIISADSMYVYKDLNIGTAKPDLAEMDGITHHMINVVSPFDNFSVSDYKQQAEPIVQNLINKGKIPIICGGTGFYINSLLYDLSYGKGEANLEIREKYKKLAEEFGNQYVYNVLYDLDPESAKKLHYNDLVRVVRALEIFHSGQKKSDIVDSMVAKYDYDAYMIAHDRQTLYDRINKRVDVMIEKGLIDEVSKLISSGINGSNQCMQAIGYKEIYEYLNGQVDLQTAIDNIKLNSRHYAKRQITFFKKYDCKLLQPADVKVMAKQITEGLKA